MNTGTTISMRRVVSALPRWGRAGLVAAIVGCAGLAGAPGALAQGGGAVWAISAVSQPSNFAPGSSHGAGGDEYSLTVENAGGAASDGTPVTIVDTLPAGVTLDAAGANGSDDEGNAVACSSAGQTVTCTDSDQKALQPADELVVSIPVDVSGSAPASVVDQASVSGGGAPTASASEPTTISSTAAPFGPAAVSLTTSSDQAGAHADLTTNIAMTTGPGGVPAGSLDTLKVDLPVGLAGYATAAPTCNSAVLDAGGLNNPAPCPASTQVGVARVSLLYQGTTPVEEEVPVYNMTVSPGETAQFGFLPVGVAVGLVASVRPGDYGIEATITNPGGYIDLISSSVTLWGVPADPSHDALRGAQCGDLGSLAPCLPTGGGASAGISALPLLRNPTACSGGPLTATMSMDSWEQLGAYTTTTAQLGPFTGCDALGFNPTISVQPSVSTPDTPSGYTVVLSSPQNPNPDTPATADLEKAVVTLPAGVVMSPSAADGLAACTDAQVGLGNASPPACPAGSTIGTATLTTPALPDQLTGNIYLAGPDSGPITGPPYRIFLTLAGDGVSVKLVGTIVPNPVTGQLTTTFDSNPQLPFSQLALTFKDGPRAPLTTPSACGTATTTSDLQPWSATGDVTATDSFAITGCASADTFAPTFTAGSTNTQAGAYSPFTLTFSRTDQDQYFSGLTATLPKGELANLSGVPLCSNSDAAAGTCPASSQVGTATIAAGPGSEPVWIPQAGAPRPGVYLTGPYEGGPYGLVVEAPAVAGPFDLGVVVVRDALFINPTTAQVTVKSDPFPTILDGIPLQIRTVSIDMNRPRFTVNPTSCTPASVTGTLASTGGMTANVSSHFQVGGCAALGFSPKLKLGLSGKGQTKSGDHPTLTATLTDRSGQANLRSAKVTLPLSMALDPNNSQHVCAYATAAAVHGGAVGCPTKTIVGKATADTPLLSQPLTGKVYLVQGLRCAKGSISAQGTCPGGKTAIHTLPTLLVPLRGQIALDLRAKSSVNGAGALVTTFATIPDAPVSKFTLQITGGKKGLLVVTGRGLNICAKKQVGDADFGAQSGKTMTGSMTLSTPCAGVKHKAEQHDSKRTTKSRRAGLVVGRRLA